MTTIQTKYGAMHLYETVDELESFSYVDCVKWLEFNDSNGCYSIEDQVAEFGDFMPLWDMKQMILKQCD